MNSPRPERTRALRYGSCFAMVLLIACVARWRYAGAKGFVIDEFHSLYHATHAAGGRWTAFWEALRADNHPPLSFLLIGASQRIFGGLWDAPELAYRLPALAAALIELVLVERLVRRASGSHGFSWPLLSVFFLGVSSLHLEYATQARMYALLSVSITGILEALLALQPEHAGAKRLRWARLRLALWIVVALHTHYFALHYLGWLALVVVFTAAAFAEARMVLRRAWWPALIAGLLSAPWYFTSFQHQLRHDLAPGARRIDLASFGESLIHLVFLNVRLWGPELRLVFIGAGCVFLGFALRGTWLLLMSRERRFAAALFATVAFVAPLEAWAVGAYYSRSGYNWRYVLPSAAAMACLAAYGIVARRTTAGSLTLPQRMVRWAGGLTLLAALLLFAGNARRGVGSEDHRGAVQAVLDDHRSGDVVIEVAYQPGFFPQGWAWDFYAPRLTPDPPARLAMEDYSLRDLDELRGAQRVHVLRSGLPEDSSLLTLLERRYARLDRSATAYGFSPEVLSFSEPRSP